ncbi:hypothetical protein [Flavobacterium sp.]|uniref:hypothetical protein n=1 Tax=Flavobacterium sp. TaxID=239 RepID=UPI0039E43299
MSTTTSKWAILALAVSLFFPSCSSDDKDPIYYPVAQFDGSHESVQNYLNPELLETMEGLGLHVNLGNTPPNVTGQFLDSPNVLEASNIENSTPGTIFADTYFTIRNFNPLTNSIDISYTTPGNTETSAAVGAVVSGHGNQFTIFAKHKVTHEAGTADSVMVVSGQLTSEGIVDFQFATFMLDNHGLPTFIANNKGRLFHDGDNLAEKQ